VGWREVAGVVTRGGTKPIKALQEHLGISRSTARRWHTTAAVKLSRDA
jgi:transposase